MPVPAPSIESISTDRLELMPLDPADAADMVAVLRDPKLYEFTGGEPPDLPTLEQRYRAQVAGSSRAGEIWLNWIVRFDGDAIGLVQATVTAGSAALAWIVDTRHQGRGFATEAAAAMLEWLRTRRVARFTAHIHPGHVASRRVARAIGLKPTGAIDDDGEEIWASGRV